MRCNENTQEQAQNVEAKFAIINQHSCMMHPAMPFHVSRKSHQQATVDVGHVAAMASYGYNANNKKL